MNPFSVAFLLLNAAFMMTLSRRWAPLPFLVGSCYMTIGQEIDFGPFHFTVIRILVAAGVIRVLMRGERLTGGMNGLDKLMVVWAVLALFSSVFHKDPSEALIFRLGLVYNTCGIYFLIRIFCQSFDDVKSMCRLAAVLLLPVVGEMLLEKLTGHNLFSVLGGVSEISAVREGVIRAQGPFAHPILAGTIGGVSLPLMIGIWRSHPRAAAAGVFACLAMIFASASSGPIMSALAGIGGLFMWRYRHMMRLVRWLAVFGYIGLDIIMKAPAYYIIYRLDVASGSTGWHRAALIESGIKHLNEWWLGGTDYTRHWMPTGVSWSPDHTDITNHYLQMGVWGGLPLMFLFIAALAKGFSFVGQVVGRKADLPLQSRFLVWALGSALFSQAVTMISVSYFDQSFVFLYLTLAAIGSAWTNIFVIRTPEEIPAHE